MQLKFIQDEDFTNYKKCAMFIGTPYCSFKCEKDCGILCCQNSALAKAPFKEVSVAEIIKRYSANFLTSALVIGGLEPLDTFEETLELVKAFRDATTDDIVIYTGYYENEIEEKLSILRQYSNIIVKFGRFIPNSDSIYDEILGVTLASKNQYAKKIS